MKRLVVASTNTGKAGEIRDMLAGEDGMSGWTVDPLPPGIPHPEETGTTFLDNAALKATYYSAALDAGVWTVADDSGLVVDALDGGPGLRSSRYAPTDDARNDRLLSELEGVPLERRTATFVCALAVARGGRTEWACQRGVNGAIALERTGTNGFGYDPLFWLPDRGRTMAELPPEVKNRISHRGLALAELRRYLIDL